MTWKIFLILIAFGCAWPGRSGAQDIHFTQYFASPMTLNPALAGLVQGNCRFSAAYRQQWASVSANPYITGAASFDMAVMKGRLPGNDAIGIGIQGYFDKAGSGGYRNTTVGITLAYHKSFGQERQHLLSFGVQGVLVQKSIAFEKLLFEDQYRYGMDRFPATQEALGAADLSYPDFNAGITYSGMVSENNDSWYCGVSWYHLTRPEETFLHGSEKINSRYTGYLGGSLGLDDHTVLYLSGMYEQQGPAWELVYGGAFGFLLNSEKSRFGTVPETTFYLGGWLRQNDALAPYIGLEFSGFQLGITYDITLFSASVMTLHQGGFEFSLAYNGILSGNRSREDHFAVPRF